MSPARLHRRRVRRLVLTLVLLGVALMPALAQVRPERQALVIGNAAYRGQTPLANTLNDARDIAHTLSGLGFTIVGGQPLENADRATMAVAINRFLAGNQTRDGIALIYYAGHGLRDAAGASYLIPTDARIEQEPDIAATGIGLSPILDQLDRRPKGAVSLVILDACRNNPFALGERGDRLGLGQVSPARGTLVLYSASPGQKADDNPRGRNGLFTGLLLERLKTPGLDLDTALDEVSERVEQRSGGRQVPWVGGNLRGKVYLAGEPAAVQTSPVAVPASPPPSPPRVPTPELVRITGGCFQMGSPAGEKDRDADEGQHQVCVEGFSLAKRELTVGEFRRFVAAMGYRTDAERDAGGHDGCWAYDRDDQKNPWAYRSWADWRTPNRYQVNRDDHPVACVSWNDAQAYLDWLNREAGGGWRLPTEAEWEYAARAGTATARYWGEAEKDACAYANIADQAHGWTPNFQCDDGFKFVAPVGRFKPNAWGLHDMLGNLQEWTCSGYAENYGSEEKTCLSKKDAKSPRVLRGGSWGLNPRDARAAFRNRDRPENRNDGVGFRLARTLAP
jgi:formylglycine-generating enzyme required for sulfatase activity